MFKWISSIALYLATILLGLLFSRGSGNNNRIDPHARVYLIWLFVFLCFGYMTGADWFFYEPLYYSFDERHFTSEPGSWLLFKVMPSVIPDFWLFLGLIKCVYLYTVYRIFRVITNQWLPALALSIPCLLAFMLIENPLRFMVAQIFINYAIYLMYAGACKSYSGRYLVLKIFVLVLIGSLFHNSSLFYFLFIPVLLFAPKLSRVRSIWLFAAYIVISIVVSNVSVVSSLLSRAVQFANTFVETKDYIGTYTPESNDALFTLGGLLNVAVFSSVLLSRNRVVRTTENGEVLFGYVVLYFLLSRLLIIVPTGFRLTLPLTIFYVVYVLYMLNREFFLGLFIVV